MTRRKEDCEEKDESRDWSNEDTSQGWDPQKPGEAWSDAPLEPLEGGPTCRHLNFGLLASRTGKLEISVVLNHPVCSHSFGGLRNLNKCSTCGISNPHHDQQGEGSIFPFYGHTNCDLNLGLPLCSPSQSNVIANVRPVPKVPFCISGS